MDISKNFITLLGWMRSEFDLKGYKLQIFGLIYGFCQDKDDSRFTGSINYIITWVGCSRSTVINLLKELSDEELIVKYTMTKNNVVFNEYGISDRVVQWLYVGGVNSVRGGGVEIERGGGVNSGPNNIVLKDSTKKIKKIFVPPTLEECENYAIEKGMTKLYGETFFNFYSAINWVVGKNKTKMVSWTAAMGGWISRENEKKPKPNNKVSNYEYGKGKTGWNV